MEIQEGSFVMPLGGLGMPRLGGWHWGACMARVMGPWAPKIRSIRGGSVVSQFIDFRGWLANPLN